MIYNGFLEVVTVNCSILCSMKLQVTAMTVWCTKDSLTEFAVFPSVPKNFMDGFCCRFFFICFSFQILFLLHRSLCLNILLKAIYTIKHKIILILYLIITKWTLFFLLNQHKTIFRWNSNQKKIYTYPQSCWQFDSMSYVRTKTKCTLIASIRPKMVKLSKLKPKAKVEHN